MSRHHGAARQLSVVEQTTIHFCIMLIGSTEQQRAFIENALPGFFPEKEVASVLSKNGFGCIESDQGSRLWMLACGRSCDPSMVGDELIPYEVDMLLSPKSCTLVIVDEVSEDVRAEFIEKEYSQLDFRVGEDGRITDGRGRLFTSQQVVRAMYEADLGRLDSKYMKMPQRLPLRVVLLPGDKQAMISFFACRCLPDGSRHLRRRIAAYLMVVVDPNFMAGKQRDAAMGGAAARRGAVLAPRAAHDGSPKRCCIS